VKSIKRDKSSLKFKDFVPAPTSALPETKNSIDSTCKQSISLTDQLCADIKNSHKFIVAIPVRNP